EDIDRFRRNRFHDLLNLVGFLDAGRVETIGAGLSVKDKPFEGDAKWIRASDQPGFTSPGQHYWDSGSSNRTMRCADAIDSQFFFVERRCAIPTVVLNRQTGHPLCDAKLCICRYRFGLIGEPI